MAFPKIYFFGAKNTFNFPIAGIVLVLAAFLAADTAISYVADFLVKFTTSFWGILLFIIIGVIYFFGQINIWKFIRENSKKIDSRSTILRTVRRSFPILQWFMIANVVFIGLQVVIFSQYLTVSLIAATAVSATVSFVLFAIFAYRLFSWFRTNRNSIVVFLYALSFAIQASTVLASGIGDSVLLGQKPVAITPQMEVKFPDFEEGSFFNEYYNYYIYFDTASFILMLSATAILLHHYSSKIGRIKFWIVILLPFAAYLGSTLDSYNLYDTDTSPDLFSYYVFQSLSSSAGGFLFAFSFWTVARALKKDNIVRTYLIIAALGFSLLYICNQATVYVAGYPPFGLACVSFLPLAAYLVFFGVYSSAVSLSQDLRLRQSIKTIATNNQSLLGSIGTAQMDQEVRRVVKNMKEVVEKEETKLSEKSGIETNITQNDMEDYMKTVMEEVARARKPKQT